MIDTLPIDTIKHIGSFVRDVVTITSLKCLCKATYSVDFNEFWYLKYCDDFGYGEKLKHNVPLTEKCFNHENIANVLQKHGYHDNTTNYLGNGSGVIWYIVPMIIRYLKVSTLEDKVIKRQLAYVNDSSKWFYIGNISLESDKGNLLDDIIATNECKCSNHYTYRGVFDDSIDYKKSYIAKKGELLHTNTDYDAKIRELMEQIENLKLQKYVAQEYRPIAIEKVKETITEEQKVEIKECKTVKAFKEVVKKHDLYGTLRSMELPISHLRADTLKKYKKALLK